MNEQKAIKYLKEKGYEVKKYELIKIPELNIEIKLEEWKKSYKELLNNIPKGFRLMKCSEIFKLVELDILDKITKEKNIFIYLDQLPIDEKNKWARVLYRGRGSGLYARNVDLAVADGSGRVLFCREVNNETI